MTAPNPAQRASAGHVDKRAEQRAEQLSVREDERLPLCVAVGQVRERERHLERNVRIPRRLDGRVRAPPPTLHDSGPHDCSYLSDSMYDNLVCAFLAYVDSLKSCYPAPSSSTIPAQNPSQHLLQFVVLSFLFAPTIVNLFLVSRHVRSSFSLHGRRHWVEVGGQFTSPAPAFGVWLTTTSFGWY